MTFTTPPIVNAFLDRVAKPVHPSQRIPIPLALPKDRVEELAEAA